MSHLWVKKNADAWLDHSLNGDYVRLTPAGPGAGIEQSDKDAEPVLVRTSAGRGHDCWTLLCSPAKPVCVNGALVMVGARVLADRDAIALGDGQTAFFSTEQLAQVVSYPGGHDGTCCIRCKLQMAPATPAVRCPGPGCGFWHHQSEERPCWIYTETCANCGHPTAFDAGHQWSPAEL